jgi:ankyrin repeat protein
MMLRDIFKSQDQIDHELYTACEYNHDDIVKYLIKQMAANVNRIHGGKTALHIASERGSLAALEILLKNGADASIRDDRGQTALENASYYSRKEIQEIFHKYEPKPSPASVNEKKFTFFAHSNAGQFPRIEAMHDDAVPASWYSWLTCK